MRPVQLSSAVVRLGPPAPALFLLLCWVRAALSPGACPFICPPPAYDAQHPCLRSSLSRSLFFAGASRRPICVPPSRFAHDAAGPLNRPTEHQYTHYAQHITLPDRGIHAAAVSCRSSSFFVVPAVLGELPSPLLRPLEPHKAVDDTVGTVPRGRYLRMIVVSYLLQIPLAVCHCTLPGFQGSGSAPRSPFRSSRISQSSAAPFATLPPPPTAPGRGSVRECKLDMEQLRKRKNPWKKNHL